MWFLPVLALLVVLPTNAQSPHLLGMCIAHQIAFPHGPENADLSQTFCNLVSENLGNQLSCDGLTTLTGSEFQEEYEASHAEFCLQNAVLVASVVAGTNPDSQLVYETALAETLFYLQADGSNDARRNLFVGDAFESAGNWIGNAVTDVGNALQDGYLAIDSLDEPFRSFVLVFGIAAFTLVVGGVAAGMGRRALTVPAGVNTMALSANDILTECAHGVDSILCELPVTQFLQLFSTGVCASVAGLVCVVNSDDLLALGGNF